MRVAVVYGPDRALLELEKAALLSTAGADAGTGFVIKRFPVAFAASDAGTGSAELVWPATASLAAFNPDIVISMAPAGFVANVMTVLRGAGQLPLYVLSEQNLGDDVEAWIEAGSNSPEASVLGVAVAGIDFDHQSVRAEYSSRLRAAFPGAAVPGVLEQFDSSYDSLYYLAHASMAVRGTPMRASDIAGSFQRLIVPGSVEHSVGPNPEIDDVQSALSSGEPISLVGTLGVPSFDPITGTRRGTGGVFCYERNGAGVDRRNDVLRYNATTKLLDGTFPCFSDF